MAVKIQTGYVGEALEKMLVRATTGNELVSKGLIRVVPDIKADYFIPRLKAGKMLQKRKEQPQDENSKGDFSLDEKKLTPKELMAFTTFNPRSFEQYWRKYQPTGELVYAELPEEGKAALLAEMAKVVDFELGYHIINGEYAEGSDDSKLFDGILTRIKADAETIKVEAPVAVTTSNIIEVLQKGYKKVPKAIRGHKNLRILMSIEDFDKYDDALSALPNKGTAYTDTNAKRFKGITIEPLADMPEHVIVFTLAGNDMDTNLWMGVASLADATTVMVAKLTNAGEKYFFKMLMKIDTNIAWGEHAVLYDGRSAEL